MILDAEEIRALTGCAQPSRQLAELHRQGFWRARRAAITGRVILERAHYDAVCAGVDREQKAPKLRDAPALRMAQRRVERRDACGASGSDDGLCVKW